MLGDYRLPHCFQALGPGGADTTVELAVSPDRKVQRVSESGYARPLAEVTFQVKFGFLAESNETADGPRQRIELAEVVENRSPDTVIGQCSEQALALRLKAINGMDESKDAGLEEVVKLDLLVTAIVRPTGNQAHLRQCSRISCSRRVSVVTVDIVSSFRARIVE